MCVVLPAGAALEWRVTSQVTAAASAGISITTADQNYAPSQTGQSFRLYLQLRCNPSKAFFGMITVHITLGSMKKCD